MSGIVQTVETDVTGVAQVIDASTGTTVASAAALHAQSSFEDVIGVVKKLSADVEALKAGTATAGVQTGVDVLQSVQSLTNDVVNVKADVLAIKNFAISIEPAASGIRSFFAHLFK